MMISDLPTDLVEEILSRVTATHLKRLGSTCKLWNGLFKDTRFTEKHLRKARKQSLVLMLKQGMIFSVRVNLNVAPPSVEFTGTLGLTDSHSKSEQVDIFTFHNHCDGLLLCSTNDNRLVVWNPCLGETTWMQHKSGHSKYSSFVLGYQKNKTCNSYKILKWDSLKQFEIYEFCSNSWRVLNDVKQQCFVSGNGVSLKGKMYSIARADITYEVFVLCFDFTTERFKHLCLPAVSDIMDLSVVGEEQLSLVNQISSLSKLKIWVTTKIDTDEDELSWNICFTVDLNTLGIGGFFYSGLLFDEEKKVALCCFTDDDDKCNGVIPMEDFICWSAIFGYVPSLVQIQQDRGKLKKN